MDSSFRPTKMASMALKKQYGNDEKLRIQSTLTNSNAERKIYSSSSFSEADDSIIDTRYTSHNSNIDCMDDSTSSSCDSYITDVEIPIISTSNVESSLILKSSLKKGFKRKRNENNCLRSINKKLRNSGKAYIIGSTGNKVRKERKMEPPCTEKCKLKCFKNFTDEERMVFFHSYWELGDIQKQRIFIQSSMEIVQPAYRYVREGGTRKKRDNNNAFFFYRNGEKVRVCKLFYKNTLNITNRTIRTVQQKRNKLPNVLLEYDLRGRHGKQKKIDEVLRQGVNSFINKIPRIESQYTRASTSKHFIDGSKTIADIHRDYMADCKVRNVPFVNYVMFYRIFTEDYNISLFSPKKDLCETCCAYDNAEGEEKIKREEYYNQHNVEKELSIKEKKYDKEEANATVVVCDLQPVMQIPKGDDSVFYYKSRLNVYNLTIYDLKSNECECFIWDESNGHRGINELGSCVLQFFKKRAGLEKEDFIFYSDNCAGLQRNKSIIALYIYAISKLNIKSITHKYLIKGHTQNEGDSVHSLIERQVKRQLKAGPMYTPELFISAVRAAKKTTKPFNVTEMCFEDFFDIKALATEVGLQNMAQLNIPTVAALRFERNSPNTVFFKTSYNDKQFRAVDNITKKKHSKDIKLTRAYYTKPKIAENKKTDLLELLQNNHIPKYYKHFYEQLQKDSPKKTRKRIRKSDEKHVSPTNSNSAKAPKRKYVNKRKENKEEEILLPINKEDGSVQCQQCKSVLDNITLWHEHVQQHRPVKVPKKNYIKKSDNDQSNQKQFECEHCGKGFAKKSYYKIHMRVHSGEQPFLCILCGKGFKVGSSLHTHMLRHKGEKTFQCPQCPKKFVCSSGLYGHMMVHTKEKPYVCDICGSAFHMAYQLRNHNLYHNNIKKYQCEYCDMRFVTSEKQRRHMRTHTGEKPYRCKYCERAFAQSNDCVKHLRQHLGDNVYQCELCPLRFPLARDLRVHYATHKDDDEETRARYLEARTEEEQKLQIKFGVKNNE